MPHHDKQFKKLSAREYSCLECLAKGARIKDIAQKLSISPRTVETYLNQIKVKLNIKTTKDLISCYWDTSSLIEQ